MKANLFGIVLKKKVHYIGEKQKEDPVCAERSYV
jgi:hypothetical protein